MPTKNNTEPMSDAEIDALLGQWAAEPDANPEEDIEHDSTESELLIATSDALVTISFQQITELHLEAMQIRDIA